MSLAHPAARGGTEMAMSGMEDRGPEPGDRVRIQIPSHPSYLAFARDTIYRLSRKYGFSPVHAFDLKLITGEAISNIIKHAYRDKHDRPIFIEVLMFPGYIEMRFRDKGVQTPIHAAHGRDLSDYRERGLGIYMIAQLSDYHYYDQSQPIGTELVVKKRLAP
ncbi:MAG: ATP-binding protein [Spirochaetales bacterium]|nr:ATP-binding protein [Leptospiraceae bacterium]MCP5482732.1 ATP-binding protein [Spirochaetales bacterium]MCP5485226.1 ATP-binding protein [Spirochaetales bacterium]